MKNKEIKKMSVDELKKKANVFKKDLFNMRFKKVNGQIQNVAEFSTIKRNIARLYSNLQGKKWRKEFYKGR